MVSWSRPRQSWALLGAVGVVALVVAVVLLVQHATSRVASVRQGAPGPVVLVPGYGGSTDSLEQLASRLRAAGHQASVLHLVGDGTGDLRVQAKALADMVAGLQAGGTTSVDVVGYSAGGIVTRLWATDDGGARVARRIVLLGTPNHGTQVAGLASVFATGLCPTACQQLVPGSDLLRGLDESGVPSGPTWVSLWTEQDDVVTPPDSANLDGAIDLTVQSVCPGQNVDHSGLPTNPVVQSIIVRALAAAPFTAPTAAECAALGG
ncbi:MAG: lipase [Candidatus Nanopelagicales bacterium]